MKLSCVSFSETEAPSDGSGAKEDEEAIGVDVFGKKGSDYHVKFVNVVSLSWHPTVAC